MLIYPNVPQNVIHTSKYLFRNERQNFSPIRGENTRKYIAIHTASRAINNSVSLQFLSLTAIHISQAHAHIPTASTTVMSIIKQKNIKSNIYSIYFALSGKRVNLFHSNGKFNCSYAIFL